MKTYLLLPLLMFGLYAATPAVYAKSKKAKTAATEKKKLSPVGKAVKSMKFLTSKKANPNAKFYIYLQTAGWCGPCNQEMPSVVKEYAEMEASGQVELILLSADKNEADAVAFLKKYNADFPIVMSSKEVNRKYVLADEAAKLPGAEVSMKVPFASIVDDTGKVLQPNQNASLVIPKWREITGVTATAN